MPSKSHGKHLPGRFLLLEVPPDSAAGNSANDGRQRIQRSIGVGVLQIRQRNTSVLSLSVNPPPNPDPDALIDGAVSSLRLAGRHCVHVHAFLHIRCVLSCMSL